MDELSGQNLQGLNIHSEQDKKLRLQRLISLQAQDNTITMVTTQKQMELHWVKGQAKTT
jgi:hypothetical protein